MSDIPEDFEFRKKSLIGEIYEAFASVDREGGISWEGAHMLDDHFPLKDALAAAQYDTDRGWSELVDEPSWAPAAGVGG